MKISKCDISKTTRSNSKPFHQLLVLFIVYKRSKFQSCSFTGRPSIGRPNFYKNIKWKNIKITTKSKVRDRFSWNFCAMLIFILGTCPQNFSEIGQLFKNRKKIEKLDCPKWVHVTICLDRHFDGNSKNAFVFLVAIVVWKIWQFEYWIHLKNYENFKMRYLKNYSFKFKAISPVVSIVHCL